MLFSLDKTYVFFTIKFPLAFIYSIFRNVYSLILCMENMFSLFAPIPVCASSPILNAQFFTQKRHKEVSRVADLVIQMTNRNFIPFHSFCYHMLSVVPESLFCAWISISGSCL